MHSSLTLIERFLSPSGLYCRTSTYYTINYPAENFINFTWIHFLNNFLSFRREKIRQFSVYFFIIYLFFYATINKITLERSTSLLCYTYINQSVFGLLFPIVSHLFVIQKSMKQMLLCKHKICCGIYVKKNVKMSQKRFFYCFKMIKKLIKLFLKSLTIF